MSDTMMHDETQRVTNIVVLEFWKDYKQDGDTQKEEHWVKWARRGATFSYHAAVENVARLKKPRVTRNGIEEFDPIWIAIKPAYEAWVAGQALPVDGTPLEAWPALNKRQVKAFKDASYHTIEDVEAMSDGDIPRVRIPDVRRYRDMARTYVANQKGGAVIEQAMAKRDAEVQELRAQLDEALKLLKEAHVADRVA
jgi:hypothetical protein